MKLIDFINDYVNDPENAECNYNVAREYHFLGQTAASISFYLRCAERTEDKNLAYECLLHMYFCFKEQKNRDYTEKGLLERAITILPRRPEAYYLLSRYYEWRKQYSEAYTNAEIGLNICDFDCEPLRVDVEYNGKHLLIFEKAVAAWWIGKNRESRDLLHLLINEYWNDIDEQHQKCIEDNLCRIGSGPESQAFTYYDSKKHSKLRHKFPGSITIERNYSQIYQDMFVLSMLNGKKNGTFLEIGAAKPYHGNNTALLEKEFNWNGIALEYKQEFVAEYKKERKSKILCENALNIDYKKLLSDYRDKEIDYLQLDIEPARNTYEVLTKIPFDEYKFAVITYEHDYYVDVTRSFREKSRKYLSDRGYVLVVNDLSPDGISNFEDWWVHPDLVDKHIFEKMMTVGEDTKRAEDYMLSGSEETDTKQLIEIKCNTNCRNTGWIVDNFYENPEDVRKVALSQDYIDGGFGRGFIGKRTADQFLFSGLKERFESIMGKKITLWEDHQMNGRFQISKSGEPLVYHCDEQMWGGMIYLTPNAPYSCGTTLYAHKQTKARTYYDKGWDAAWINLPGDPHLDGTSFEPVDVFGNVYNRLVIFDASAIHSASQYFGTVDENARLWHMFFFDTEE